MGIEMEQPDTAKPKNVAQAALKLGRKSRAERVQLM
jgi:hypothetical protein